ncbi:MAG: hypothetical protein E7454_00575 [Ruminococcaceae bacterium]|nr:hypothetical protein [Oscillospiraceae bacterium]
MSKMKKVLLMCTAYVLVAALAIGGTIAYLQDTDSDVNVMTLGNVSIDQHEYERATNTDGSYETKEIDGVTSYVLKDFTQGKPLLPSALVTNGSGWGWDSTIVRMTQVDSYGGMNVFKAASNAQDKFVTVENTGKTDAYIRTLVAIEIGSADGSLIGTSYHSTWNQTEIGEITIDGNTYVLIEYAYEGGELTDGTWRHQYGILPAGDTSYPNLSQVYISAAATNEDMVKLDGNGNGTLDILVLSQAVQAAGFADAKTALDTAFGKSSEKAAEWFNGVWAKHVPDLWDGSVDTTWYNDTDTEFTLTTAEQLAGLAELVDGGNNFAGKTVKLGKDLDLAGLPFNPIGHSSNGKSFNGTFDGQGHTISNMYEQSDLSAWQYEGEYYGLFAYTNGATIKNVTIADAYISSGRNEAAGVVGNAVNTTFSDITISNTTLIAYNNSAGGVAAECYGNCSFTNITVDKDTVIGPLWGTYDVRLGGVVGMVQAGNNVTFKDITVACQLDAINDVAANYQYWLYRYSGMLIGHVDGVNGVADPSGYVTCENVKVIYGDWVNYHYCEFESLGAGSYNGPGEYKYARVEAGTGTDGIDLSTCNHDADESHNVLIVFDQLFGGGQGVSGLKTYDGVTVVYPNN